MALPINIDELLRTRAGNGNFLATMPIHQAFVDENAYLFSIGQTKMSIRIRNENNSGNQEQ